MVELAERPAVAWRLIGQQLASGEQLCCVPFAMLLLLFCLFCFVSSFIFFGDTKIIHKIFFAIFCTEQKVKEGSSFPN